MPDHAMTFRSLCNLLQDSVTPFVVSVHAKECAGVYFCASETFQIINIFICAESALMKISMDG